MYSAQERISRIGSTLNCPFSLTIVVWTRPLRTSPEKICSGLPVTSGFVQPDSVRVVVTGSTASVPGCPDWQDHFASNLENATSDGFGCAINGNFAAMVADPEHLLHGAEGTGETVVMSSTKAIEAYREQANTGSQSLEQVSTQTGGN